MMSRRHFIKNAGALAGLAFCGCCLTDARAKTGGDGKAKSAFPIIKGKCVKTIDIHSHCYFHESLALAAGGEKAVLPPVKGQQEHFISIEERLAAMDKMGIDMEVLNINPFWYKAERDAVAEIVRINNEKLAELCALQPKRFAAFASLSLQFPELAVQQLETAVKKQGLRGAAIGGSVAGEDFSDPKYHPVWAKAEELVAVLFIHPQSTPDLAKRFKGNGWLSNTIGNPLDTTIALEHLIYEGTLDKFPSLKIVAAHGGGYLGSYAPRMDRSFFISPQNCDSSIVLKKKPSEYLKQIYFDALVFTPEAVHHLAAEVGASQFVLGTDFPIPW
ncbi:MAG: amidohydrolase family protein [Candidatus Protistobacter heckmanni]|nr:amidohydrolase family protein [Candidatus Protistobacter heckmanni]